MRTPKHSWMTGPLLNPSVADTSVELKAGQIVTVDWRRDPDDPAQDPHPPEPNKLRPAVVVQDCELFDPAYPTVLVVPMTGDLALAIAEGMHWRATYN